MGGLILLTSVSSGRPATGIYRIEPVDFLNPHFVRGETVQIRVFGPSEGLTQSSIRLNGRTAKVTVKQEH